jgi:hypothetical protein
MIKTVFILDAKSEIGELVPHAIFAVDILLLAKMASSYLFPFSTLPLYPRVNPLRSWPQCNPSRRQVLPLRLPALLPLPHAGLRIFQSEILFACRDARGKGADGMVGRTACPGPQAKASCRLGGMAVSPSAPCYGGDLLSGIPVWWHPYGLRRANKGGRNLVDIS